MTSKLTLGDAYYEYIRACNRGDLQTAARLWRACQEHIAGETQEHERRAREVERAAEMEARIGDKR